ncbi:hypothetical protein [Aliiroseovarius subalbicans]|uniref:hypothetical protein n=1 Tax=Aliiroseovarius subalbicans TaxID=2925840 RepID=UPI001F56C717|nr:hypothetical protein [Aliiroseovarius subalbicans]MCI2399856.1 hypothetical protein [Aliiroseovarius subalbicans]
MPNDPDLEERKTTTRLFLVIAAVVVVLALVVVFVIAPSVSAAVQPGMGLKDSALIAFGATVAVIVVMTVAAGDGLLGEIQFTLPAFFVFFILLWVLIAWVL